MKTKHTIVALVENKPGVLNRIVSKWRQRGFNIESLAVGHSEVPGLSRMTFVLGGPAADVEQVTKQLYKVVDVVKISDLAEEEIVTRELALLKVNATDQNRSAIIEIVDIFKGDIVDVSPDSVVVEITGTEDKVDAAYRDAQALRHPGAGPHRPGRGDARPFLDDAEVGRRREAALPPRRSGQAPRGEPA